NLLVEFCQAPDRRRELADRLIERHLGFARELELAAPAFVEVLDAFRNEAESAIARRDAFHGAERDRMLGWGERLSAALFAAGLEAAGVPARPFLAGDAGLVTDDHFGAAHPLPEAEAR